MSVTKLFFRILTQNLKHFEYSVLPIQMKGNTPSHFELDREDFTQRW